MPDNNARDSNDESLLPRLQLVLKAAQNLEKAIKAFTEAEATAEQDPCEGTAITKPRPANDGAKIKTAREIGDEMEDGTIYAGISPDTRQPIYATPADAPGIYTFNEAAKYAKNLNAHGHQDFHVPSKGELNVLWENRHKGKLASTFNETGNYPAGWYGSSSLNNHNIGFGWAQRFRDGNQDINLLTNASPLRLVR